MRMDRRLFAALLALPNLAAAFSSAGLLFLPGATYQDQRLVSSMGSVSPLSSSIFMFIFHFVKRKEHLLLNGVLGNRMRQLQRGR